MQVSIHDCGAHLPHQMSAAFLPSHLLFFDHAAGGQRIHCGFGQRVERRQRVRQEQSRPRVEALRSWCEAQLPRLPGAPAMLNMLPKFELVPIMIYFMTFANVRRTL